MDINTWYKISENVVTNPKKAEKYLGKEVLGIKYSFLKVSRDICSNQFDSILSIPVTTIHGTLSKISDKTDNQFLVSGNKGDSFVFGFFPLEEQKETDSEDEVFEYIQKASEKYKVSMEEILTLLKNRTTMIS